MILQVQQSPTTGTYAIPSAPEENIALLGGPDSEQNRSDGFTFEHPVQPPLSPLADMVGSTPYWDSYTYPKHLVSVLWK